MGMLPAGAAGNIAGAALKNGIPVAIGGTTASPTFTPDLNGLFSSGANSAAGGSKSTAKKPSTPDSLTNSLGGLLKQH